MKNQQKLQKLKREIHFKARQPILLVFMILAMVIFSISFASAFEFDNAGRYDEATKTITIKNGCDPFGLVCLGQDIATAKLLTPKNNKVPLGKNILVAEIEVKGFTDYDNFFSDLEMFDLKKGNEKDNRVYDIKIRYNESFQVDDYGRECSLDPQSTNGTNICERVKIGSHNEVREIWKELAPKDLRQNSVLNVGIFTEVKNADSVEWIPELFGVKIEEWAIFSATGGTVTFRDIGGLNFSVHTFTTNGTFTVTGSGNLTEVLIVAGGGAGGGNTGNIGAGAGAGGLVFAENLSIVAGSYPIIVGIGGLGTTSNTRGNNGQNSSALGLVAIEGGGGGSGVGGDNLTGADGGSGGGGGFSSALGGTALQGNFSNATGFGRDGGDALSDGSGSGGGANNTGITGPSQGGGNSSNARAFDINGTAFNYSCGGSGGGVSSHGFSFCGGGDGGGDVDSSIGGNATTFGSGGGGSGFNGTSGTFRGGDGFQGVVIILFLQDLDQPTINLDSPEDNANFTITNNVTFNATIFHATNITNVTLYLDDVINATNTTAGLNNSLYTFDVVGFAEGDHPWTMEACNFDDICGNATARTFNVNTTPFINYTDPTPINEFNSTNDFFQVNVTITEDLFLNLTFDLYDRLGSLNQTITFTNSSRIQNWSSLIDGNYSYNVTVATTTNQFNSTATRNITIEATNPALEILAPPTIVNFHEINTNLFVNWSINDTNLDTCILEYESSNTTLTCSDNTTSINITTSSNRIITIYANDTFGNVNSTSRSWNYNIFSNAQTFNTTIFETELNNFTINLTYNSTAFTNIETNLIYNSTRHASTQIGTGDDVNFSTTIARLFNPPNIKPFFWNFRITNTTGIFDINSTEKTQVEQPILFGLCNSTLTTPYVNFTFKDEGNLSLLNASVPSSTFVHTLGNFTINKSITFINTTVNENYTFCLDPPNRTLQTAFSFQYEAPGYQQRVVEFVQSFNSTLTTNILFLLSDADGLFVTFQVINTAEQTIENAIINASRIIDSIDTIVGTGLTSAAGTRTFWLNPNFLHTINVFKAGFPQFSTSLFPDQTAFTINLGGTAAGGEEDFTQGITVDIFPKGSLLNPNESFVFNYTLGSSFFTVDEFSFGLRDEDGNIYANETASTNGGTISTTLNTSNNVSLIMDYNWLINGNFTNNSRSWLIFNDTADSDWSIRIFASDLILYIDDGLFGIDDFGLAIVTFLTIFLFTGLMSARFGLVSPAAVTTLMFTLVLFFDVGLGLMDNLNPIGAVPNFPTIIMGIMLAGVLMKDGIR